MSSPVNIYESFRSSMVNNGIFTEMPIIPDGNLHRFHIKGDKLGSVNGWYILFPGHVPYGKFGSWKTGVSVNWSAKSQHKLSPFERIKYTKHIEQVRRQQGDLLRDKHSLACIRAADQWNMSTPANPNHPYLLKKQIPPFIAQQIKSSIVLPICDVHGKLWSLQFIHPNGSKTLLSGGAKKGHFIPINGRLSVRQILICEGFATGASLALGYPSSCVIAAIDAGNLEHVAVTIRRHYPNAETIMAADDDRQTEDNPGLTYARQAALASGALMTSPLWPHDAPITLSDFNDLACWLKKSEEAAS